MAHVYHLVSSMKVEYKCRCSGCSQDCRPAPPVLVYNHVTFTCDNVLLEICRCLRKPHPVVSTVFTAKKPCIRVRLWPQSCDKFRGRQKLLSHSILWVTPNYRPLAMKKGQTLFHTGRSKVTLCLYYFFSYSNRPCCAVVIILLLFLDISVLHQKLAKQ